MGRLIDRPPPGLAERLAAERLGLGGRRGDPRHFNGFDPGFGWIKESTASRLTIGATKLTSNFTDTDGLTFVTASVSPAANRLLLLGFIFSQPTIADPTSIVGNGLTWVQVGTIDLTTTGPVRRLALYRSMGGSPSSGAITATWASNITAAVWTLIELSNVDTSGTNGSGAIVGSPATVASSTTVTTQQTTLPAFEHANNVNVSFVGCQNAADVTPDAQFAELSDDASATPANRLESEWAVNETVCDVTHASTRDAMISVEVKSG